MYLNDQELIPYDTLRVLVAEINYGGRVTDDKDVRLIKALLEKYFTPEVMESSYSYSTSAVYRTPEGQSLDDIKNYIKSLPLEDDPELFGLHSNANITFNKKTVGEFRDTITLIHPKVSGGTSGKSSDDIVNEKLGNYYDQEAVREINSLSRFFRRYKIFQRFKELV